MQDNYGLPFIQNLHECIELGIPDILPATVRRQLDTVRTKRIQCIDGFPESRIHIRQGK